MNESRDFYFLWLFIWTGIYSDILSYFAVAAGILSFWIFFTLAE